MTSAKGSGGSDEPSSDEPPPTVDKLDKAQHCSQALLPALCIASTCDPTMLLGLKSKCLNAIRSDDEMQSYLELLNSDDIFALFKSDKLGTNFFQWNCSVCVPKAAYREKMFCITFQLSEPQSRLFLIV